MSVSPNKTLPCCVCNKTDCGVYLKKNWPCFNFLWALFWILAVFVQTQLHTFKGQGIRYYVVQVPFSCLGFCNVRLNVRCETGRRLLHCVHTGWRRNFTLRGQKSLTSYTYSCHSIFHIVPNFLLTRVTSAAITSWRQQLTFKPRIGFVADVTSRIDFCRHRCWRNGRQVEPRRYWCEENGGSRTRVF